MFSYIKGTLEYIGKDFAVIDVNGVGYKIYTAVSNLNEIKVKDVVKMYTYLHVREDILAIYGFVTSGELEMFELLLSVSGVGPKAALSLVSAISPSKFALSLITNDSKALTCAQGIGIKVAQRIILELKDKVKTEITEEEEKQVTSKDKHSEAINALIVLGYSYNEASKAVKNIDDAQDVETMIKIGLKNLVRYWGVNYEK